MHLKFILVNVLLHLAFFRIYVVHDSFIISLCFRASWQDRCEIFTFIASMKIHSIIAANELLAAEFHYLSL